MYVQIYVKIYANRSLPPPFQEIWTKYGQLKEIWAIKGKYGQTTTEIIKIWAIKGKYVNKNKKV